MSCGCVCTYCIQICHLTWEMQKNVCLPTYYSYSLVFAILVWWFGHNWQLLSPRVNAAEVLMASFGHLTAVYVVLILVSGIASCDHYQTIRQKWRKILLISSILNLTYKHLLIYSLIQKWSHWSNSCSSLILTESIYYKG